MEVEPGTEGTPPTPAAKPQGETKPAVDYRDEKIERLQAELSQERTKVKTISTERDTYKTTATKYEFEGKKGGFLDAALSKLGDDFTIEESKLTKIRGTVKELGDSPTLEATIADLVELAKAPKGTGAGQRTPFTGQPDKTTGGGSGSGHVGDKKPEQYSADELKAIRTESPERYREIMDARQSPKVIR